MSALSEVVRAVRTLDHGARFDHAACERLVGQVEAARSMLSPAQVAQELEGGGPNAEWLRARALSALNAFAEALVAWDGVIEHAVGPRPMRHMARSRVRLELGDVAGAAADLREAFRDPTDYVEMERGCRILKRLKKHTVPASRKVKVAVLGTFTTKLLCPLLELAAFRDGVSAEIYEAEYDLVHQEVLDTGSGLHAFKPDVVIIAQSWRDARLPPVSGDPEAAVGAVLEPYQKLWSILRNDVRAHVIQHNFDVPTVESYGHLSSALGGGRARLLQRANQALLDSAGKGVSILDFDGVAGRFGKHHWVDPGHWYRAKQYPAPAALPLLVDEYMMHIRALLGLTRKVLVLDLDNTVWGGIVGEDGLEGLKLGVTDPEGEAHTALQHYARELKERGIVLAVCSKNNEADAREPFQRHPEMVLKLDDIAMFVANWQDKVTNLREIAKTLDLGLDSFVFLDDNPTERAWVRSQLPEVAVPEIGDDAAYYLPILQRYALFDALTLSEEDRLRAADYAAQGRRAELQKGAANIEDFIRNLQMSASVRPFEDVSLPRIAQLVNKSNQFNLTTIRRTEEQLRALGESASHVALSIRLSDRFADNGLIGVMIGEARPDQGTLEIDTWLMSCRVLGRRVEEFMCGLMMRAAEARGLRRIVGRYVPTAKNALVKDLYPRLGFELVGEGAKPGETVWEYRLDRGLVTNDLIRLEGDAAPAGA